MKKLLLTILLILVLSNVIYGVNITETKFEYQIGDVISEIIPLKYNNSGSFSEGLAPVCLNGKWGYIDKSGNVVISFKYDTAKPFSEGLALVEDLSGESPKDGYIDKNGNEIIPVKYGFGRDFSEGLAAVRLNDKIGYIDKSGKEVIPSKYDHAGSFSEGLAYVKINDKYGYIDKSGNVVIPIKYNSADDFSEGLAKVYINGKYGYIDKSGNEIIPAKYDSAETFSEGLAVVCLNDKYGYIDKSGNVVIPIKYNGAGDFSEGLARAYFNDKNGYIDKSGKEVIPSKYDHAGSFSEGLAAVSLNMKYGYIDKNGNEIIPLKYDFANDFSEGLATVRLNDKCGVIGCLSQSVISNSTSNTSLGTISGFPSRESELRSDNHFYLDNNMQKSSWVYYTTYYYHVDSAGNIEKSKWIEQRYVGDDGKMYRGRQTPDGKWVGDDGLVVNVSQDLSKSLTKKAAESDSWYKTESGLWYYFENDRTTTKKGWFIDTRDNQTYYLDPNTGIMALGWTNIDGKMYYFNELSAVETNWYEVGNGFYESYGKKIKALGSMYKNETTPDGKKVDENGRLVK